MDWSPTGATGEGKLRNAAGDRFRRAGCDVVPSANADVVWTKSKSARSFAREKKGLTVGVKLLCRTTIVRLKRDLAGSLDKRKARLAADDRVLGAVGNVGLRADLARVPCREAESEIVPTPLPA